MKKLKITPFLVLAFFSEVAMASISGTWSMPNSSDEVFKENGTTPLVANSVWQLIWSPDNAISPFNPSNPFEVDSSEVIFQSFNNPDGSFVDGLNFSDAGDTYVGGFVYTRAFDYTGSTSSFNLIDLDGMKYIESGLSGPLEKIDGIPAGSPTTHNPFVGPNVVDQTFVIPEPTTVAVLLMGIVGIFGFRRYLRD